MTLNGIEFSLTGECTPITDRGFLYPAILSVSNLCRGTITKTFVGSEICGQKVVGVELFTIECPGKSIGLLFKEKLTVGNWIAIRIKETRERIGISQIELARRAKITSSGICQMEKGQRIPNTSTILRLAEVLGVTIDYLAGRENAGSADQMVLKCALALYEREIDKFIDRGNTKKRMNY
jgi:transcriptional regulator with XRE-family HTH domain